jgi:hypothetical protein
MSEPYKSPQGIWIACKDCGERFIFTEGEREYYSLHGLDEPRRCVFCRRIHAINKDDLAWRRDGMFGG